VKRDAQWGPVIAVGLGGVWVEALDDTSLRTLPVVANDVLEMLDELRGSKLLDGFRGAPSVDRLAVADAIVRIGYCALELGPDLLSLEINPLSVSGSTVEALDALVIWNRSTLQPASERAG
jgi:succinyl-CoA synthetase beta subunit